MKFTNSILVLLVVLLTGCAATTPMAPLAQDTKSKTFSAPAGNLAGIYIYRNSGFGKALKKAVFIDKVSVGETAPYTYFHKEVTPGEHTISTESEFGNNDLKFNAVAGRNYFFQQYIKMGVFVGGSNIEAVTEEAGKRGVLECKEAM